jgi:hypothetical protein
VGEPVFYPDSGYAVMIMSHHEIESIRGIADPARPAS